MKHHIKIKKGVIMTYLIQKRLIRMFIIAQVLIILISAIVWNINTIYAISTYIVSTILVILLFTIALVNAPYQEDFIEFEYNYPYIAEYGSSLLLATIGSKYIKITSKIKDLQNKRGLNKTFMIDEVLLKQLKKKKEELDTILIKKHKQLLFKKKRFIWF
jgi:hypothetical protein